MIAYNQEFIRNIKIVAKAKQWYAYCLISSEQMATILKKYPVNFYKPNLFVKIGLFIFTCIIIGAALGLYSLVAFTANNGLELSDVFPIITCFLFAIICLVSLELFIRSKITYNAGVDEALLYSALGFVLSGILFIVDNDSSNGILFSFCFFLPFLIAASIRYMDSIIAILTVLCVYNIFFLLLLNLGEIAKLLMPFAFMLLSAFFYFFIKKQKQKEVFFLWNNCLIAAECIVIIVFYLGCNYFVIRESSVTFFDMQIHPGGDIPLSFVFYCRSV